MMRAFLGIFGVATLACGIPNAPSLAGDAATWRAADVQALETCPGGGIKLPGSHSCMRIGGRVSADATVRGTGRQGALNRSLTTRQTIEGRVSVDVRSQTELGPVRAYASVRTPNGRVGGERTTP